MQVTTACPHCSARFQVAQAVIGKRTRCTKCGERFVLAEVPATPVVIEKPPVKSAAVNPDSFDIDFDGPTQSRNDVANVPPVPPSPPEFKHEDSSTTAIAPDTENRWLRNTATPSRDYWALRIIARTLEFLAIIFVVLAAIAIAILCYEYSENRVSSGQNLSGFLFYIFRLCVGVGLVNLVLLFISNIIRLGIQIERNTFASQELLEQMAVEKSPMPHRQQSEP
ncbi:MJ0042-type zinc finger domain-containing protein [Bythopirellula goksoeyrii]|uniref:Zinc finger/thioredoxin putative domain-containing protein n=1 Tax=Bythopirellula goksoeyrii TaxID=1400387 RepID=A0A5B9Q7Y9_9BACT|nr:MJ0042-type zinc finger domain-containing protein [Bythopirellula goksoeyrii]QEG35137.1 hypothetical protein Pr1d_24280 [Bythopirellula goksoeyrii]